MKAHRFAFVLIAALATILFIAPLLGGHVFTIRDHLDYFQPLRFFTAEELKAGRLPVWNPYSASGEPWLANPQTGVFYPPTWLFVVLPFETAYMLFLLLHLAILGWGAYLLFARHVSQGAAMVGAVAAMFSGPVLSLLDINNNLATLAWIPFVLWCAEERAWRRGALALALAFLGGEPFFAGLAAVMFAIVAARSLKTVVLAALAAFGLSAVQLLPFLHVLRGSDRANGFAAETVLRDSMPLRDWLRIVIPPSFESGAFDPVLGQHFIPVVYVGIVVAILALIGLASIRKRPIVAWVALLVVVIVVAAGPPLLARLPLTLFRYPARLVPLGALAIAALAAAGWDRLRPNRRWVDLILILIVSADLLPRVRPLLETAPFNRHIVPHPREIGAREKFLRVGKGVPDQRVNWISGYLNLYDRRFDANTAAPFASERYVRFHWRVLESPTRESVAFLSAGYVLSSMSMPKGLQPVGRAGEVTVYRNPSALPMARLGAKAAEAWEMDTRSARVTIDAPEDGLVVLAQQLAPSWRVTVDGDERVPRLVDGIFRGVEVTKGRREIVWTYHPPLLFAGALMTIITALAMQISFLVKRSR